MGLQIWFNENMQIPHLAIDIPSGEITPLVSSLLNIIAQQQQMIESQQERIALARTRCDQTTGRSPKP